MNPNTVSTEPGAQNGGNRMNQKQPHLTETGTVRSSIRMLIPLNKQSAALEILEAAHARIQSNPNCICTHLYRGVDDVRAIMIEERWASDEDLTQHLRSEVYQKILLVIEMSEEPPEIIFDVISKSAGIEKIMEAKALSIKS
jgi:quinol monooxygenase YgiN